MENQIKTHKGLIVSTAAEEALVRLTDLSAGENCGGCALSSVCRSEKSEVPGTLSEITVKASVPESLRHRLSEGSEVVVEASATATRSAIIRLLVVPLAVLLVAVAGLSAAGVPEWASALCGVVASGLSYLCVNTFSRGSRPSWRIVKVEESQN